MSSVERAVYEHLTADSAVAALVSTRVYVGAAAQNEPYPRITLTISSETPVNALSGAYVGMSFTRMDIASWGETSDSAIEVAEAVRLAVHGFRGLMGSQSLDVRWMTLRNRVDRQFEPISSKDRWVFQVLLDTVITHRQPIPALPA